MKRSILRGRVVLAGAAALAALILAAACGGDSMDGMDHDGAKASPAGSFNDADVTFAQNMIPHHEQAVEMATLAGERASDPETRKLAGIIKAAQDPEIQTLKGWLAAWGQPTVPPGHGRGHGGMPGMMSETDMARLKDASGAAFDRLFAQMMIAHHKGAIEMARDEQAKGANAEARALAATIERTQSDEVNQLMKLLERL